MTVNLSGATGHVAVVGGPRSGKSTLLRTIVTSMALTTTPLESQFFVLDFGGGTFAPLAVAPPRGRGRHPLRARRRTPHRRRGPGSRGPPRGLLPGPRHRLDRDLPHPESRGSSGRRLRRRVPRGRRLGHAARRLRRPRDGAPAAVGARADLRPAHRRRRRPVGGLPLGDARRLRHPARAAARRPDRLRDRPQGRRARPDRPAGTRPGAGQAALPRRAAADRRRLRIRRRSATASTTSSSGVAAAWRGPSRAEAAAAARTRSASTTVRAQPRPPTCRSGCSCSASTRRSWPRSALDADAEPHLLVFGDGQSGKSALLRTYVHEIMRTRTPKEAQIVVVDYRRSLLGEVPDEYLLNYLTSAAQAGAGAQGPGRRTSRSGSPARTSPPTSCATGPGGRAPRSSWWSTTTTWSPPSRAPRSQPLQPLLAQARDVGLHLAIARRSGGASRALYEPVIQSLRDLAMPGLLLSGSPDEGPLLGNLKPAPAPPGRGRLVSRDRGREVVQLGWLDPSL